ncbi:MAG: Deoxyribodipyrimidine photolyase [uncultured Nocardioidaceae bacterium]|uniref:Deoxyribodipyrimidine photolyase n=1 Tax=uncultured Nocardioidaceae bacterium TaxID=253824 RepID=A0A6J4LMI9_9ACTN|nr:MAG: Deoxyribodipyrimidine photolyase [uncultured Nocardioidaceae bacterium]
MGVPTRWLFGDQLGPHFTDDHDGPFLVVESAAVLRRKRFHRQKAHLVFSAMRHRVAELEASGREVRFVRADTYREALGQVDGPLEVMQPTSFAAVRLVERLAQERELHRLPARGFMTSRDEFTRWVAGLGNRRLLMEDYYRDARRRFGVLLDDGGGPAGGRWNYDHENREPPPRGRETLGVPEPWFPQEDEIDEGVRRDLDAMAADGTRFVGRDGPRLFAATAEEARTALDAFVTDRLPSFGAHEDAMLAKDPWLAHSMLSAAYNLGLLDPAEAVSRVEAAWRDGSVPLQSAEGYVRQVIGWREYMWHLYWHFGDDYRNANELGHDEPVPDWFDDLDAGATDARCLSDVLGGVAERAWVHHIPRLMVLGGYALQRGWNPRKLAEWFHYSFVDGYDWVMTANVVGMSQHADGGLMTTKPYTSGGAYINRMSDYCGDCVFDPKVRVGDNACPYTAGYWWFMNRHRELFSANPRMRRPLQGLDRLSDVEALLAQEDQRGSRPPTAASRPS